MARYRICLNSGPHHKDYWTVEREERGLFGRARWTTLQERIAPRFACCKLFASEAEAQAWIDEAKRPRVHKCGEPQ